MEGRRLNRFVHRLFLGALICLSVGCVHRAKERFDIREEGGGNVQIGGFEEIEDTRKLDPRWLEPSSEPYKLGIGDWLEIEISGIGGSRAQTFIMPDGRLYYDLAGGVKADGLTITELGALLNERLSRDYSSPQVSVTLREVMSRRAWLMGRLNKPGLYPLSQPTTLLEGISLAGGLFTSRFSGTTEELADLVNSFVLRDGVILPIDFVGLMKEGDMSQNIYLEDGDYVYLPSSLSNNVLVLGAVFQPQSIGFKDKINLVSALAHVKGPKPNAHLDRVLIIRNSMHEPKVAVVDLASILAGRAPNVMLKPFDIVWIPDEPFEKVEEYFWVVMRSAATGIAVREGTNSVETAEGESPSVVIPIGD